MTYSDIEINLEILRRLGINTRNRTSGNISIKCWDHNDKNPSMSINIDKGLFYCFSCGSKGTLKTKYYREFGHSIYKDLGIAKTEIPFRRKNIDFSTIDYNKRPEYDFKFEGKRVPLNFTDAGKRWIEQRGFNDKLLDMHKVKYATFGVTKQKSDPTNKDEWVYLTGRALFPIYEKGELISIEARDIHGEQHWKDSLIKNKLNPDDYSYRKVLYPKHSSVNTLYDLDNLNFDKKLYVTEGLMDVISLRTHPQFQNSTSTFGVNITERQFYLLKKFKEICFIPNLDLPGIVAIKKLQENNLHNASVLWLPESVKDINDILQKKDPRFSTIEELINKFKWGKIQYRLSAVTVDTVLSAKKLI